VNRRAQVVPWVYDESLDDYACAIHCEPVADCPCPGIDVWVDHGLWPYQEVPPGEESRLKKVLESADG